VRAFKKSVETALNQETILILEREVRVLE